MGYQIRGCGPQISESEIESVANDLKLKLPHAYVEFLTRHNGGRPVPKFFKIRDGKGDRIGQVLDFFGIDDPVESCNIQWNFEVFAGRIPFNLVPTVCEDGGNLICIGVGAGNCGKIYYWDHDLEHSPPSFENVYEVADSFDGFMDGLFAHEIDKSLLRHAMGADEK